MLMAAGSPVKASDSNGAAAVLNGNGTPKKPSPNAFDSPNSSAFDMPKTSLRGLNKPRCIVCKNVARSRCPFQCCKKCCSEANNPCYIHVLKENNTLPEKPPPSASPSAELPSTEVSSTGSSWRLNSLRQNSHNVLNALRTRKPLTKKDIARTNKWRFTKLREHIQGEVDAENEAFERYIENIRLLEETFAVTQASHVNVQPATEASPLEDRMEVFVSEAKVRLQSDATKEESYKERIRGILEQKLKNLREPQYDNNEDRFAGQDMDYQHGSKDMTVKLRAERTAAMGDLLHKLSNARSEDDMKHCLDMRNRLFLQPSTMSLTTTSKEMNNGDLPCEQELKSADTPCYSFPKVWTETNVDADMLSKINAEFSSLSQIVQL